MSETIYSQQTLLRSITIEREGNILNIVRENISGIEQTRIILSMVDKIELKKEFMSYTLTFFRKGGMEPVRVDRMTLESAEALRKSLESEIEIEVVRRKSDVTIEDARKDGKKIISQLEEDFDTNVFLSFLLNYGVKLNASDIHITPGKNVNRIQFRIDGLLTDVVTLSQDIYVRTLVGLKNFAKLATQKVALPQVGMFNFREEDLQAMVRCSTVPTMFGEKVDLRILNTGAPPLFLEDLGFSQQALTLYKSLIHQPHGCIILSGPSGSGKSTTIYASLISLYNTYERSLNIATIEDPVDYVIEDFQQTQLKKGTELTYDRVLKSLMNLNPDVILVGEIRDHKTADAVVRASLSGKLIFTTILARNSIGVFSTLLEMGGDPQMVTSAVTGVLYQDLVRKLCPNCKVESNPPAEMLQEMEQKGIEMEKYYTSKGCSQCDMRGYRGQTGVFELLPVDDDFREMITRGSSQRELIEFQEERGMKFLWEDALEKVARGITDYREVKRVCPRTTVLTWSDIRELAVNKESWKKRKPPARKPGFAGRSQLVPGEVPVVW